MLVNLVNRLVNDENKKDPPTISADGFFVLEKHSNHMLMLLQRCAKSDSQLTPLFLLL